MSKIHAISKAGRPKRRISSPSLMIERKKRFLRRSPLISLIPDWERDWICPITISDKKVNKKICDMAKDGLLKFDSIDEFESELKELELKHNLKFWTKEKKWIRGR